MSQTFTMKNSLKELLEQAGPGMTWRNGRTPSACRGECPSLQQISCRTPI